MRQTLILLLLAPVFVWADSGENIQAQMLQYESELARLQQEAQTAHQQFMMIQELRRNEINETPIVIQPSSAAKSIPIPNYDDMVKKTQQKQTRIQQYGLDLNLLYLQHKELEERRRALFQEIDLLKKRPEE